VIKAIAEGRSILDKKVDGLSRELNETKIELKREISVVKDYVIGVDTKLNEHEIILKRVK